jgi:hypothetical protein
VPFETWIENLVRVEMLAVCMCRLARIAAIIPSTLFRPSSIWEHRVEASRTMSLGYQFESIIFAFSSPTAKNRPFGGLDDGSRGAGIRTLDCSKNLWEDFDEEGGSGWLGEPTTRYGDCG